MKKSIIWSSLVLICLLGLMSCKPPPPLESVSDWEAEGNVDQLVQALSNKNPQINVQAAEALGKLKVVAAIEPLAAQTTSPNYKLMLASIEALIAIDDDAVEPYLIDALKLEPRKARILAIDGLGARKSQRAFDSLAELLKDDDIQIVSAAAQALGQIKSKQSIPFLAAQLQSSYDSRRLACAQVLEQIGGRQVASELSILFGDKNKKLRQTAINTFIALGKDAQSDAMKALHNKDPQIRNSAVAILSGIDAVPPKGRDRLLYLLAKIPLDDDRVDDTVVEQLVEMGAEAIPTLVKALSYNLPNIREHAFRAVEQMGKPCVAPVVQAIETKALPEAKQWFSKRSSWYGAPSWRIDLWAAATALDPEFKLPKITRGNRSAEQYAIDLLSATRNGISRVDVPLLISLLIPNLTGEDSSNSSSAYASSTASLFGSDSQKRYTTIDYGDTAALRLRAAGELARFPLMAVAESGSSKIAEAAKQVLLGISADQ